MASRDAVGTPLHKPRSEVRISFTEYTSLLRQKHGADKAHYKPSEARARWAMELKVVVMANCPKCPKAKEVARRLAEKYGLDYVEVRLDTPEGQIEGLMYNVLSTPSIAIGDEVVARGELPTEEELEEELLLRLKNKD